MRTSLILLAAALVQAIMPTLSAYNIDCLNGLGPAALAASHGPGLAVTSGSPLAPTGVTVISDNAYSGPLAVAGEVPFLGVVALDGRLPSEGLGTVSYVCGKGNVAIMLENLGRVNPEPLAFVMEGLDYSTILVDLLNKAGLSGCGCNSLMENLVII